VAIVGAQPKLLPPSTNVLHECQTDCSGPNASSVPLRFRRPRRRAVPLPRDQRPAIMGSQRDQRSPTQLGRVLVNTSGPPSELPDESVGEFVAVAPYSALGRLGGQEFHRLSADEAPASVAQAANTRMSWTSADQLARKVAAGLPHDPRREVRRRQERHRSGLGEPPRHRLGLAGRHPERRASR
jgi:hypothetical protein